MWCRIWSILADRSDNQVAGTKTFAKDIANEQRALYLSTDILRGETVENPLVVTRNTGRSRPCATQSVALFDQIPNNVGRT
jgi:hypothetical protein